MPLLLVGVVTSAHAEDPPRAGEGHVPPKPAFNDVSVSAGAGMEGFVGTALRDAIGPGVSWYARAAVGTISEIRVELVYTGSSQPVNDMPGVKLTAHGVYGLLRINVAPGHSFEPFVYAGGGWSRFWISASGSDFTSPDDVLEIPFGLGVARRWNWLLVDVRAGISVVSGANLVPLEDPTSSTASGETMHRIGMHANVGFQL
ncbi:MAG TPA: hypothetical protein VFQ53_03610 [Kofleriaceae bacterium]|nr:hypothetical protein [Kofleriaceae bacterium]